MEVSKDVKFLKDLQHMFQNRFSDDDDDYMTHCVQAIKAEVPVLPFMQQRNHNQLQYRQQNSYELYQQQNRCHQQNQQLVNF